MPEQPDLGPGRRHRRQGRRRRAGHEGHLPARPAGLGRDVRAADHGGEHLRRHLVRRRTGGPRSTPRSSRRRSTSTSTWSRQHGEPGAAQAGFTECLNAMSQSKVAMWYDATSAAGSLEDPKVSKVAGKVGYALAPVKETEASGWLWAWAWAMPKTTKKADAAAKFMLWASSKEYEELVGEKLGWARVPAGKRETHLRDPGVQEGGRRVRSTDPAGDRGGQPENPGVQPRPTVGVQFVGHPGVPGPRHQGVAGHRRGHRRTRHGRRGAGQGPGSSPRTVAKEYQ